MRITEFFEGIKSKDDGVYFEPGRIIFEPPLKSRDADPGRWDRVMKLIDEKAGMANANVGPESDIQRTVTA